ncbi:MAG: hypothetical protein HOP12_13770 [Candidatus Eisenbacteria bacterium]|uniref:Tetratricopeptide repeat protein n=1 Tax=Eiseniibacteriota bacterium TaxID=2212470 RepID=A0A849SV25_UNCEI|nr:hypothetical protein [Candidatus Eisenbacteria bacterium]
MRTPFVVTARALARSLAPMLLLALLCGAERVHAHHTRPAPEPKRPPARRITGLGGVHFEISSRDTSAQSWFDQGLRLCYAFNHDEAIRAFERAAAADSGLAIAYWGIAYANGPNINLPMDAEHEARAREALSFARARLAQAAPRERDYVEALGARYDSTAGPDRAARDRAYAEAMRLVQARHPDDLDAAVLYADALMNLRPWQLWSLDGTAAPETPTILERLESVLRRDPEHTGAIHFYIHAVEASPDPERALAWAARLPELTPNAGHLVHMPTHLMVLAGDYFESGRINDRAAHSDREYLAAEGITGFYSAMYYNHNLHMAAYSYAMAGHYAEAMRAAREVVAHASPQVHDMPMLELFTPSGILVQAKFRRWTEVLAVPAPAARMPMTTAMWRFARGLAFAATGRPAEAEREARGFAAARAALPADFYFGLNPGARVLAVADAYLSARLAEARGDRALAGERFRSAASAEDSLAYDEPPDWYVHPREAWAGLLLRAGDARGAETVLREELARRPRSGRALFGLAEALERGGRALEARGVRARFERAWQHADTPLRIEDL